MEAIAQYDYSSRSHEELSFSAGSILKILNEGDRDWYHAELKGILGLVPANYVSFEPPYWYKDASKEEICDLLRSDNSANFFVRPSQSSSNEMSLSVMIKDIQHFRILRSPDSKYYLWNDAPKFESINKLIQYYEIHSVCNNENVFLKCRSTKVIVEFDFESRGGEEISIFKGDVITFIERVDDDWSKGSILRKGKKIQGLYPNSYVRDA